MSAWLEAPARNYRCVPDYRWQTNEKTVDLPVAHHDATTQPPYHPARAEYPLSHATFVTRKLI